MKRSLFFPCLVVLAFTWVTAGFGEETMLEEVVVTATKTEKEAESSPASVNVVTKKDIESKHVLTIDDTIQDLPGVMVKKGKGIMSTMSAITLRGVPEQKRTLVMMDNITLNNPYTGNVKVGGFYPEDLERVEVVRGPFSSLYGGYAMGGVVNFITKMPEKREVTLKSGYGSSFDRGEALDDLKRFYLSYGDKVKDKLSILMSYGYQSTNGYAADYNTQTVKPPEGITGYEETKDRYGKKVYKIGDKGDNEWWDDGITLKAQYSFSKDTKTSLSFMRNRYEYSYDDPHTYLRDSKGNPLYSYSTVKEYTFIPGDGGRTQNTYSASFETFVFDDWKVKANFAYLDTEKDWYITALSKAKITGGEGYISDTDQEAYEGDIQFTLPLSISFFPQQIITFGGSFRRELADSKEENLSNWKDEDSKTNQLRYESKGKGRTAAFFVQDEIPFTNNFTVYLGIRYDWWETYDGYVIQIDSDIVPGYPKYYDGRSQDALSPKLALVYKPLERTTLRGSIGKSFRSPSVYELYRTWRSSSGVTYAANPSLEPETAISWDVGITQNLWAGSTVSVTYFDNYFDDLIYRKSVAADYKEYVNVGKAESRGVEFEVEQQIDKWLKLFGNFTYTDAHVTENQAQPATEGKKLTYTPKWKANIGARIESGPFGASLVGRYMDKWFIEDENKDKERNVYGSYDEHFVVDLKLSYQITKNFRLSFAIDNLFDEDYYEYYKAPGRSWYTELTIKF